MSICAMYIYVQKNLGNTEKVISTIFPDIILLICADVCMVNKGFLKERACERRVDKREKVRFFVTVFTTG